MIKTAKPLGFIFLLFLTSLCAVSQVTFSIAPENLQLYPRDSNNVSEVIIRGNIQKGEYTKITLKHLSNNKLRSYTEKTTNSLDTSSYNFEFKTLIEVGLTEYDFHVFLHRNDGDSVEVLSRKNILCGDFFVLYGQSNIEAYAGIDDLKREVDDRFLRTYGFTNGTTSSHLQWHRAKVYYGGVGSLGLVLQGAILEKYKVPTCFINGSEGGASISYLTNSQRNYVNPRTRFDMLATKIIRSGAKGNIKGFIWRQGETEICTWEPSISDYPLLFERLYNQMRDEFGSWNKFYNIQLGIHTCNKLEGAGFMRDYIRRTKYIFDKVETTTAIGVPNTDPFHHSLEGYRQIAMELLPLIERDSYGLQENPEFHAPDIQRVELSASGDTLALFFEEGQKLNFPSEISRNGVLWKMEDYFYINGTTEHHENLVSKGWASGNIVFLALKRKIDGGYLTYLPSYAQTEPPSQEINLTNSRGLRAMSFYKVSIDNCTYKLQIARVNHVNSCTKPDGNVLFSTSLPDNDYRITYTFDDLEVNKVVKVQSGMFTIDQLAPGMYKNFRIAYNGCSIIVHESIEVNNFIKPEIFVSNSGPIYERESLQLFSDGGKKHLWTGPEGFQSSEQNPVISDVSIKNAGTYHVTVTTEEDCLIHNSTEVTINVVLGIDNEYFTMKAYPNPIDEYLKIEVKETEKISIAKFYDTLGKLRKQVSFKKRININVSDLPSGLYTINIESGKNRVSSKLIKN